MKLFVLSAFPFGIVLQQCPEDQAKEQPVWLSNTCAADKPASPICTDVLPWGDAELGGTTRATSRSSSDTSAQQFSHNTRSTAKQP